MKIGFIGAGKVGCSLGKYFSLHGARLTGYASRQAASAKEAADFTDSNFYPDAGTLIADSDMIFVTVSDGAIATVWDSIKGEALKGKMLCHCSGSLSSGIFSDSARYGAFVYSIHPFYAISSKWESYRDLSSALFTLEGDEEKLDLVKSFLEGFGNPVQVITRDGKAVYHAAAVFASNHMVALAQTAINLLGECGFSPEHALSAITPLMQGNLMHIVEDGTVEALTGPVERNDCTTIKRHLDNLPDRYIPLYQELSKVLVEIGEKKHPETDYGALKELLK